MPVRRLFALGLILAANAGNPAAAQDDALIRMVLLTQMYQEIAARCNAIAVDPDYSIALDEVSEILRTYVSDEVWEGMQTALTSEGVDCSPENEWVQMLLSAQQKFVDAGGEMPAMRPD